MARRFVGTSSQYLEYSGAVVTAAPFTTACWFWVTDINTGQDMVSLGSTVSTVNSWRLSISSQKVAFQAVSGGIAHKASASVNAVNNVWAHACGVEASPTLRTAYYNGSFSGTNTTSHSPSVNCTNIGCYTKAARTSFYDGLIAEAAIWNAALTDTEVLLLAQGALPCTVRPQSLVAYWPLAESGQGLELDWNPGAPRHYDLAVTGATPADSPDSLLRSRKSRRRFFGPAGGTLWTGAFSSASSDSSAIIATRMVTGQQTQQGSWGLGSTARLLGSGSSTCSTTGSAGIAAAKLVDSLYQDRSAGRSPLSSSLVVSPVTHLRGDSRFGPALSVLGNGVLSVASLSLLGPRASLTAAGLLALESTFLVDITGSRFVDISFRMVSVSQTWLAPGLLLAATLEAADRSALQLATARVLRGETTLCGVLEVGISARGLLGPVAHLVAGGDLALLGGTTASGATRGANGNATSLRGVLLVAPATSWQGGAGASTQATSLLRGVLASHGQGILGAFPLTVRGGRMTLAGEGRILTSGAGILGGQLSQSLVFQGDLAAALLAGGSLGLVSADMVLFNGTVYLLSAPSLTFSIVLATAVPLSLGLATRVAESLTLAEVMPLTLTVTPTLSQETGFTTSVPLTLGVG